MNILKYKIAISIIIIIIISTSLLGYNKNIINAQPTNEPSPLKVSVLIPTYKIQYLGLLTENLKKIQQQNPDKVEYTFYDADEIQETQNKQINDILSKKKAELIIIDLVDNSQTQSVIDKVKQSNLPVIVMYNGDLRPILSYGKAYYAATNPREAGSLEGNIVVDAWNKNQKYIDKNHDNILNYILLLGVPNNINTIDRPKYALMTINNNKIQNKELGNQYCNWDENVAKQATINFLLKFGNSIEAIITADDSLAIGAVKGLQQLGYNLGNKENTILVVGVNGVPQALELINKGYMTGTVIQDSNEAAKNFYVFGMNLLNSKKIIDGTNCTVDITGKIITMPNSGVAVNFG